MKTLILKGSPRQDGNTSTMADRFAAGLRAAGHDDVNTFSLNELTIRPCQACNGCFKPPFSGCVLDDDFQTIYPVFRDADLVVFAAPVYWWHLCAQMKAFVDRMHPMLTFDQDHCLPTKELVLLTAYFAEDPYGVGLMVKTFESIAGWAGMRFQTARFHSANAHVRGDEAKLAEVFELGRSFAGWTRPTLSVPCPVEGCRFRFRDTDHAAMHLVMAAGDDHLAWKAAHLSQVHTLLNTGTLVAEAHELLKRISAEAAIDP